MKTCLFILLWIPFFSLSQKAKITVQTHIPYCGGAKPTPEMAKGRDEASVNYTLVLIERRTKNKIFNCKSDYANILKIRSYW